MQVKAAKCGWLSATSFPTRPGDLSPLLGIITSYGTPTAGSPDHDNAGPVPLTVNQDVKVSDSTGHCLVRQYHRGTLACVQLTALPFFPCYRKHEKSDSRENKGVSTGTDLVLNESPGPSMIVACSHVPICGRPIDYGRGHGCIQKP